MNTIYRVILTAAAGFLMLGGSAARAQNDAGNAANGKQIFIVKAGCYECHGTVGQGGTGPHLAPKPLPIATLSAIIRKGIRGMPSYGPKVLTDAELADIRAYLMTIPEPQPASSIALLNQ
jgi:ubiquinol-cytochrome c reductase cytochrome c subunit